jgi:hypothetical protein
MLTLPLSTNAYRYTNTHNDKHHIRAKICKVIKVKEIKMKNSKKKKDAICIRCAYNITGSYHSSRVYTLNLTAVSFDSYPKMGKGADYLFNLNMTLHIFAR